MFACMHKGSGQKMAQACLGSFLGLGLGYNRGLMGKEMDWNSSHAFTFLDIDKI